MVNKKETGSNVKIKSYPNKFFVFFQPKKFGQLYPSVFDSIFQLSNLHGKVDNLRHIRLTSKENTLAQGIKETDSTRERNQMNYKNELLVEIIVVNIYSQDM